MDSAAPKSGARGFLSSYRAASGWPSLHHAYWSGTRSIAACRPTATAGEHRRTRASELPDGAASEQWRHRSEPEERLCQRRTRRRNARSAARPLDLPHTFADASAKPSGRRVTPLDHDPKRDCATDDCRDGFGSCIRHTSFAASSHKRATHPRLARGRDLARRIKTRTRRAVIEVLQHTEGRDK